MRTTTIAVLLALTFAAPGWAAMQFEENPAPPPASRPPQPAHPPQPSPPSEQQSKPRRPPRPPAQQQQPAPEHPAAPARSDDANLLVDPRSRCAVWVPDPIPGEIVRWSGRCSNGLASGTGELLRQVEGQVRYLYQGTFEQGRLVGRAMRISANGERLEADFREGQANGRGTMEYRDGVYEGDFRNGLPHGQGVRTWRDTLPWGRYEGQWADGVRSGTGRMDFGNGSTYEGGWRNDKREGQGTFRWNVNGVTGVYIGEWRNDKRSGAGSEIFTSQNARIEGTFVNDRPEGRVVYVHGNSQIEGEIYDGCLRTARNQIHRIMPGSGDCR